MVMVGLASGSALMHILHVQPHIHITRWPLSILKVLHCK